MGTQRRKRDNRNDSYRSDDYGQRNYRRNSSTNSLTSFLIMALFFAGFVLLFLLFLTFQKSGTSSRDLGSTDNQNNMSKTEVSPKVEQPSVPVKSSPAVQTNPEPVSKQSQKASSVVKDLVGDEDKQKKVSGVVINVFGDDQKKNTEEEKESKVVEEKAPAVTKPKDDEPVLPKTFMGGLTNPELEEASKASREERRRKKAEEIE